MISLPADCSWKRGRIECSFSVDGRVYTVAGDDMIEVRRNELELRQRLRDGERAENRRDEEDEIEDFSGWTLDDLQNYYYENRVGYRSSNTLRLQVLEYQHLRAVVVGHRQLGSFKVTSITFYVVLQVQHALNDGTRSAASVNHMLKYLSALIHYAEKLGIISSNPVRFVEPVRAAGEEKKPRKHRALSERERTTFFDAARECHSYWRTLFLLAVCTGMRLGELGALCWRDVDKDKDVIHVRRTLTTSLRGVPCVGRTTKTPDSCRNIPMNAEMRDVLREQKQYLQRRYSKEDLSPGELVFPSRRGTCLRNDSVNTALRRVCDAAGMEAFSFHAFRATFATCCVEQGMKPETLQRVLGHASIVTTMDCYYTEQIEKTRRAMNKICIFQ